MNKHELISIFEAFKSFNVLIIGDVMVDAYMWGDVKRISPEAPVPIITGTRYEYRLGGAANVGRNVLALGAKPFMCSVIGHDEKAKILMGIFEKRNINTDGILRWHGRKTTCKTRIICGKQHILRVDEEDDCPLDNDCEIQFIQKIEEVIKNNTINAIIFEDYDKGVITENAINQVVTIANSKNIPTLVDPKKRNFALYKNITLFKPNFKELVEGTKKDIDKGDFEKIYDATLHLQQINNIKYVFVTLSELGVFISNNGNKHILPSEVRHVADVSGAGDTVIGVAALCLAANLQPFDIAAISNLAAGLVCEEIGVVPVDKDKLWIECLKFYKCL